MYHLQNINKRLLTVQVKKKIQKTVTYLKYWKEEPVTKIAFKYEGKKRNIYRQIKDEREFISRPALQETVKEIHQTESDARWMKMCKYKKKWHQNE